MIKFFQSFYGKLSIVFLFVLAVIGFAQIQITTRSFNKFITEVDQRINLNLARDMARDMAVEIKDLFKEDVDYAEVGNRIHYMMVLNPKIEIYIVDHTGAILAFFAEPGKTVEEKHVDMEPIKQFLSDQRKFPILGDDPRQPGKRKPFSAAQLDTGVKNPRYIYIIIGGEQYDSVFHLLKENYIGKTMVQGLIVTVIFAAIIGLVLFALMTKRLRTISDAVIEFEKGNFQKRVNVRTNDEFGQLGKSFNEMADTIVANMDALKKTDDLRRELIANVSHDLRSPLTSIQGYLETFIMKETELSPDERKQYLGTILNNTFMLNKLVYELFELSKFDAGQIKPNVEPFFISELVQDVVMKFKPQAEKFKQHLDITIRSDVHQIYADIGMIERALSNLIDNAIQYTPEDGYINVEIDQNDGKIRISVHDTGYGISKEDLPHIFDRFYKSERNKPRKTGSTGLGLAITKKIIEAHNSEILVSSRVNKGTIFSFELPIQ
ncbi:HAMP domain-containing protein [candidate division KSB1 bacterium]|nr:HAMP domain-containing protein [candidate division KSB1 bacterium]